MKTAKEIVDFLQKEGFIELENPMTGSIASVSFRNFFQPRPEFLMTINAMPGWGCVTPRTMVRKLQAMFEDGWTVTTEVEL